MTTPTSSSLPQEDPERSDSGQSRAAGTDIDPAEFELPDEEQEFAVLGTALSRPAVSATPVLLDNVGDGDDAEDYDDETGGRAALDLDAAPRRAGRSRSAPLDLTSLIGEFEAQLQQQQRPRSDPAPVAPASPVAVNASTADGGAQAARLQAELDNERANVRRAQADLVNARRKAEQERARAVQEATERVIRQFFPLFDDFERGLISTRESRSYDQLSTGVDGILRNAEALLARYGVQPTQSIGQLFDPTLHEAIGVVETSDEPEDTVMEELRRGYTLGDRLLRAAMVRVARRPAGAPSGDAEPASFDSDTDAAIEDETGTESAAQA